MLLQHNLGIMKEINVKRDDNFPIVSNVHGSQFLFPFIPGLVLSSLHSESGECRLTDGQSQKLGASTEKNNVRELCILQCVGIANHNLTLSAFYRALMQWRIVV